MLRKQFILLLSVFITTVVLTQGCSKTDDTYRNSVPTNKVDLNIYDYLLSKKETFETLVYIVDQAQLADTLRKSKITFFAPTNQSILTALENLNVNRSTTGLPPLKTSEVPPFIWRTMLMRYIIPGEFTSENFALADGLDVITLNKRKLHVNAQAIATQGSMGSGSLLLKYSDLNGSRFTKDWVFSYVTSSNLQAKNGIIHTLEPSHVFGFRAFVRYAGALQNLYSDRYYISSGRIVLPTATRDWLELGKELIAIDETTVQTDAADLKANGYFIRLKVNPVNNLVTVSPAPSSVNQTLQNNGDCHYDPINQEFVLNYKYTTSADRFISERIKLRNY